MREVDNCQIGVFLAYVLSASRTLLDLAYCTCPTYLTGNVAFGSTGGCGDQAPAPSACWSVRRNRDVHFGNVCHEVLRRPATCGGWSGRRFPTPSGHNRSARAVKTTEKGTPTR